MKRQFMIHILRVFIYGFLVFLIVSSIPISFGVSWQLHDNALTKKSIMENEKVLISLEKSIMSKNLDSLFSDITYLSNTFSLYERIDFSSYLTASQSPEYTQLVENWTFFVNSKRIYNDVRFISKRGMELIKINYAPSGSYASPSNKLRYDKPSYYFLNTGKNSNTIYLSAIEPARVDGEIEIPIQPILKLTKPFYNQDGYLIGIITLTYNAKQLLDDFHISAATSHGSILLLNADGYWLHSDAPEQEWTFMFEDKKPLSFAGKYPNEWKQILGTTEGEFISDQGYFAYSSLNPQEKDSNSSSFRNETIVSATNQWYIVSYINPNQPAWSAFDRNIHAIVFNVLAKQKWVLLLLLVLVFTTVILIDLNRESAKVIRSNSFDSLTNVYNRKTGLYVLEKMHEKAKIRCQKLSVCYVDIDGLKHVNDTLGHEAGDELIRIVTSVLKNNIRSSDMIVRLGGDEFLIVLSDAGVGEAEDVWGRIIGEYGEINRFENLIFRISASHGVEEFTFSDGEAVEDIIRSADHRMYEEKKRHGGATQ